jgi:hypothetical protein
MTGYSINPGPLMDEFNEAAQNAQAKAFITIGIEIQEKEILVLQKYITHLIEVKAEFIGREMESEANLVFCIVGSLLAVQHELQMLVNIKSDKMSAAWGSLIYAQTVLGPVIRNYPLENTDSMERYLNRLVTYEKLLFPQMEFFSAGYIIKKSQCSICKEDPEDCDHLKGKLYMGELCYRIIVEADLLEGSTVKNPANKLCRTLAYQIDGKTYDPLTLRETNAIPQKDKNKPDNDINQS